MSDNIKMMKADWNGIMYEINGMTKAIPVKLKENGADCTPEIMEMVDSYFRLINHSNEFVTHYLNMCEELMEELKEVKELIKKEKQ